jgi:uncharacterized protein YjdB
VFSNGSVQSLGANATWTSGNAAIATTDSHGLINAVSLGQTTIQASFGSISGSANLTVTSPTFVAVGNPVKTRYFHTATLLPNGKVLVAGGEHCDGNGCDATASAELYDPVTQTFAATGNLMTARMYHSATLLPNGKVLIAGGGYFTGNGLVTLASTELYDPATGTFSFGATMFQQSAGHAAVLMNDGKVLIVAGQYSIVGGGGGFSDAEIYDSSTGFFSSTGNLNTPRSGATATLLNDGTVLVAGASSSAPEIYDPTAGTFTYTANFVVPGRTNQASTLLNSGKVLVTGGSGDTSAELYDPTTRTFALTGNLSVSRSTHTATLLNNGSVLVVAGSSDYVSAELFGPSSQTFTGAGGLLTGRYGASATLLNDGRVLIVGGDNQQGAGVTTAELYSPTVLAPYALQVTPATAAMQVGDTRQFTAVSNLGFPRNDALWSVSDGTLATITSDASLTLTALAPGQVTLTAQVQGVSAQSVITISDTGVIPPVGMPSGLYQASRAMHRYRSRRQYLATMGRDCIPYN